MSEERISQISKESPMWRTELIVTDACNFKCGYCKGLKAPYRKHLELSEASKVIEEWSKNGLFSIRFSGGEPTLHNNLLIMVWYAKTLGAKRVALSTNGSAEQLKYKWLIEEGVDDFSFSLDACCASFANKMAGTDAHFDSLIDNIKFVASQVYTTVGIVLTEDNLHSIVDTVCFASELGVADIRIISAAQYNKLLAGVEKIPASILDKHPILKYRVNNILQDRNVRGIKETDSHTCFLQLDDSVSAGGYFWPCVIYMREGGEPIGKINSNMRTQKYEWMITHDTHIDFICRHNCLDMCIDYNNQVRKRIMADDKARVEAYR